MKRSRSGHSGADASYFMMRVHSTCASGASAIGVPGCPEFAFWTASIARPRTTLIPRCSISPLTSATATPLVWRVRAAYATYPPTPVCRTLCELVQEGIVGADAQEFEAAG